jgi:predicted site-specific integrase-resolvase
MPKRPIWIEEQQAAKMFGYKPITFRRYVKFGKLNIAYFTLHGKRFQYNLIDIEKVMEQHSTLIK